MASKKTQRKLNHQKEKESELGSIAHNDPNVKRKQNDEKDVTITANEIQNLKKKVAGQKETIDDTGTRGTVQVLENKNEKSDNACDINIGLRAHEIEEAGTEPGTINDYLIEDLFADIGKIGNERDKFKAKYENALTQVEVANEKIQHLENEGKGFINASKSDADKEKEKESQIHSLKETIDTKEEIIKHMIEEIVETSDERDNLRIKYEDALMQLAAANEKIENLENENEGLKKEVYTLTENVKDVKHANDKELACTYNPIGESQNDTKLNTTSSDTDEKVYLADSGIDISSLTKLIDDRVEAKLRHHVAPFISNSEEEIVEAIYAGKSHPSQPNSYTPQYDRETNENRDMNLIIHGINEGEQNDQHYLPKFLDILGVNQESVQASHRLGRKSCEKRRPLKVVMRSVKEKEDLMSRLGRLRTAEDKFRKVSVTDDYTEDERREIRRWVEMAKEKNANNATNYEWKVRGTPKTGMRLTQVVKHF